MRSTTSDGTPFKQAIRAAAADAAAVPAPAIWARAHLRDLKDSYTSLSPASPGQLRHLETQITETSLRFGVLCRLTAWVAADTRVVTDGGVPHRVTQPVELPAGWDPQAAGLPVAAGLHDGSTQAAEMAIAGVTPGAGPRSSARRPRSMPLRAAAASGRESTAASRRRPARRRATAQRSRSSAPGTRPARNSAGSGRFSSTRTGNWPCCSRSGQPPGRPRDLAVRARDTRRTTGWSGQPRRAPAGQRDGRPGSRRAAGGGARGAGRFRGGRPRWSVGTRTPRQYALPAAGREYLLEAPRLTHAARGGRLRRDIPRPRPAKANEYQFDFSRKISLMLSIRVGARITGIRARVPEVQP